MEYIPSYTDQLYDSLYLAHHGILGMKWGVRRYQNEDGSRTTEGKRHEKTLHSYGTAFGSSGKIKQQYKAAKKAALMKDAKLADKVDRAWDDANAKTKADLKSGKISKQEANKQYASHQQNAFKGYAKSTYGEDIDRAKADYHQNRAYMFENRARNSEANSNTRLTNGLNDTRRGKAIREQAKADVYAAKASGNKQQIATAKKALRNANWNARLWGDRAVGSYNRYIENGASSAKAILKTAVGGSVFNS